MDATATIASVPEPRPGSPAAPANTNPFRPGAMVVVTLGNPREKFWGSLLALAPEGLSLCGVELASFDGLVAMIKEGAPLAAGVVFFPMHRVERVELDRPDGDVPSLSQRFASRTGLDAASALAEYSCRPGNVEGA